MEVSGKADARLTIAFAQCRSKTRTRGAAVVLTVDALAVVGGKQVGCETVPHVHPVAFGRVGALVTIVVLVAAIVGFVEWWPVSHV